MNHYDDFLDEQSNIFKQRRDTFEAKLKEENIPFEPMKGGIFLWLKTPPNFDGESFVDYLLQEQSILVAPGIPFGEHGKNYVRISLALDDEQLKVAAERIQSLRHLYE